MLGDSAKIQNHFNRLNEALKPGDKHFRDKGGDGLYASKNQQCPT